MSTLKLYGFLRGRNLDVNSLLHIPTLGTFQMSEVYALKRTVDKNNNNINEADETWELVQQADAIKQETLDTEAQYDEMNAEQTWPTEQELKEGKIGTFSLLN